MLGAPRLISSKFEASSCPSSFTWCSSEKLLIFSLCRCAPHQLISMAADRQSGSDAGLPACAEGQTKGEVISFALSIRVCPSVLFMVVLPFPGTIAPLLKVSGILAKYLREI